MQLWAPSGKAHKAHTIWPKKVTTVITRHHDTLRGSWGPANYSIVLCVRDEKCSVAIHGEVAWAFKLLKACTSAVAACHDDALRGCGGPTHYSMVFHVRDQKCSFAIDGEPPWRINLMQAVAAEPTALEQLW